MKVKMKRCMNCKTLLSNSAKVCIKCGSRELEKGVYSNEPTTMMTNQVNNPVKAVMYCPTCGAGITTKTGYGECSFCGDEISGNGSSYYQDYIDQLFKDK
jgi:rRNA maturation endonuclease Nob1